MKHTLKRNAQEKLSVMPEWQVEKLYLEGRDLSESLKYYLSKVMVDTLDPDVAGKRPDKFVENIESGRLGDYSRRYIATARDGNKVVGIIVALPESDERLHILTLGTLPAYRNKGVGTAMLTKCINEMADKNIKEFIIDAHDDNLPALNLYKKLNFK